MRPLPSDMLTLIDHGGYSRALVFLHPGMGAKETWSRFPEIACEALKISGVVYSRPEYEKSGEEISLPLDFIAREAERLEALLIEHGIEDAVVIGSSDGASIALEHAARFPRRVQCVVSMAAHVMVDPVMVAALERLRREVLAEPTPQWLTAQFGSDGVKTALAWCRTWKVLMTSDWSMRDQLGAIACPVLAMQGTEDRNGSMNQLDAIAANVAECTVMALPGLGHFPFRQAPEELSDTIAGYLRERVAWLRR